MKRTISLFLCMLLSATLFAENKRYTISIPADTNIAATQIIQEAFNRYSLESQFLVNEHQIGVFYAQTKQVDGIVLSDESFDSIDDSYILIEEPILDINFIALSSKENETISDWKNLANQNIGIISSNLYLKNYLKNYRNINIFETTSKKELYNAIQNKIISYGIISTYSDEFQPPLPEGIYNAGTFAKHSVNLLLSKNFKFETKYISKALREMKKDGSYKKILNNLSTKTSRKNILFITSDQENPKTNKILENKLLDYCSQNNKIICSTLVIPQNYKSLASLEMRTTLFSQIHNQFAEYSPSAIITLGTDAAQFAADSYETLFKGTPVILIGIPETFPNEFAQLEQNKLILKESISTEETVSKILELFPQTTTLFLLNDKTETGKFWQEKMIYDIAANFPDLTIKTNQNIPDYSLEQTISLLHPGTVILTGSINNMENCAELLGIADVPVFGLDYTDAFEYQIGGKYSNKETHFEKALTVVDSLFKNIPLPATESLIINPQKNKWIYNYKALHKYFKFPFSIKQIKNAEIKNKPRPFYQTIAFNYFLFGALISLLIAAIIIIILEKSKLKKLKTEKHNQKETFDKAQTMQQMVYETANKLSTADLNNNLSNQLANILETAAKITDMDKVYIWKVSISEQMTQPQCTLLAKWEQTQSTPNMPLGLTLNIDTFFNDWGAICKTPRPVLMTQAQATGLVKYQMAQSSVTTRLLLPVLDGSVIWGFTVFDNSQKEIRPVRNTVEALTAFTQLISFREIEHNAKKFMKEAQEAAISGINAKNTFLANMSHEIRTPLNAIMGMSELVLLDNNLSPHIREYAQNINSSSRNLLGIINDILDFSKIESVKLELIPASYDFESLIHDVISMVRIKSHNTFLSLFIRIAPDIPKKLIGDELRIKQILINLFTNAIKYTKEGSVTLTISDVITDNTVEFIFEMQDTGIGIKPEEQSKLFNMFERLDTKRNRNIEGTGLGLTITKQLCELMDGSIEFASEYGNGSTFTAQIKQRIEDNTPLVNIEKVPKKKILIYEPRRRHRRFLTIQLTDIGITPVSCANTSELTEAINKQKTFDYIFVSPLYLARLRSLLKSLDKKIQIVVLADSEYEFANMKDVIVLQTPVYCVQLANFLSEKIYKYTAQASEKSVNTIYAPDAKVLVVDDNIVNLKVASGLLETHGIIPLTATSGFDALTVLHQQKLDLVFMDHLMPEMDGIETTQAIRKLQNFNRDVVIIALTANAINGMKEQFIKEGMDDFIAKPIEKDKLNEILIQWLPENKISYKEIEKTENEVVLYIPGIDTVAGMNCAGNSLPTYLDILETYAKDAQTKLELLKKALQENDLHNFTVHVHALKSASRSIGASYAGTLAENLEKAGAEGKRSFIDENAETCFETIGELIENIKAFFETQKTHEKQELEEGSLTVFEETCASIKQDAENFNIIGIQSKIESLCQFEWQPEQKTVIEHLKAGADSYDYEKILNLLK